MPDGLHPLHLQLIPRIFSSIGNFRGIELFRREHLTTLVTCCTTIEAPNELVVSPGYSSKLELSWGSTHGFANPTLLSARDLCDSLILVLFNLPMNSTSLGRFHLCRLLD